MDENAWGLTNPPARAKDDLEGRLLLSDLVAAGSVLSVRIPI
jgi:hypothetical protein